MKSFLGPKSAVQRFAMGCWMLAFGLTSLAEVHAASIFLNPPRIRLRKPLLRLRSSGPAPTTTTYCWSTPRVA